MNKLYRRYWLCRFFGGLAFVAFGLFSNIMIEDARGSEARAESKASETFSAEAAACRESDVDEKKRLSEAEWNEVVKLLNAPHPCGEVKKRDSSASLQVRDDKELMLNLLPALPTRALMASLSILPHLPDEGRGGVSVKAARHVPAMSRMRVEALDR